MKNISALCTFIIIFFAITHFSFATVRLVPSQYSTIQAALNACQAHDTVRVAPGTYHENLSWPNITGIKLLSTGSISNTIIDGNAAGSVFSFSYGSPSQIDNSTLVSGFTIRNGKTSNAGAAFYLYYAGPTISSCMITSNVADGGSVSSGTGGLIYSQLGNLLIQNCKFMNNSSVNFEYGGGLIFAGNGSLFIKDCVFAKNLVTATTFIEGGIIRVDGCTTNISGVTIKNNTISITNDQFTTYNGAIIKASGINKYTLTNVLIVKNSIKRSGDVTVFGGVAWIFVPATFMNVTIAKNKIENENSLVYGKSISGYEQVKITNTILWNTGSLSGSEIDGFPVVSYSDVRGGFTGNGNINADPLFTTPSDFHLLLSSPCINAGTHVGSPPVDIDGDPRPNPPGSHPDMGCYEMNQETKMAVTSNQSPLNNLAVYPNPGTGMITITYNSDHQASSRIVVSDLSEREVFSTETAVQKGMNHIVVDLSSLNSGMYLVRMVSGSTVQAEKIQIVR